MNVLALGQAIPLCFQTFDYDADKFVRAYILDEDNNPISDSPVNLSPVGDLGLYRNNDVAMPDSAFIVVQYLVYDDSDYTTLSSSEGGASETFILDALLPGQDVPMYCQLFDYKDDKFIQAVITDPDGEELDTINLELLGSNGIYGSVDFSVDGDSELPYVVVQYIVYDDEDYTTISTSEGAAQETFFFEELNALPIDGTLPWVGGALLDYFQPMVFTQLVKTVVNSRNVEKAVRTSFRGVWQPFAAQKLEIMPQGQRSWSWFQLHAEPTLILNPDDVVKYNKQNYRVMSKQDYSRYGYMEYHLILDYTGSGP